MEAQFVSCSGQKGPSLGHFDFLLWDNTVCRGQRSEIRALALAVSIQPLALPDQVGQLGQLVTFWLSRVMAN